MATQEEQKQAEEIRREFIRLGGIPASLRSPLMLVEHGEEIPGTAADVIEFAREVLTEQTKENVDS